MPETLYCQMNHRALLHVSGADALPFLQNLLSNDLTQASEGRLIYALLLTPQGKFAFDCFVAKTAEGFLLDCDREQRQALMDKLQLYKMRAAVALKADERKIYFIFTSSKDTPRPEFCFADPRTYNAHPLGWRAIGEAGLEKWTLAPLKEYHTRRIAEGVPEAGIELTGARFPLECNLDFLHAIDFHKGCYIGQEVTSRMKRLAAGGRKRSFHVETQDGAPLALGTITCGGRTAGELLSTDGTRGLALLRTDKLDAGAALLDGKKIIITTLV